MAPLQKERLVRALRQERHEALRADPRHSTIAPGVAFCGDGANDVGALRAADVSVWRSPDARLRAVTPSGGGEGRQLV